MAFKMKNPSMAKLAKQAGAGSPMKKNGDEDDRALNRMYETYNKIEKLTDKLDYTTRQVDYFRRQKNTDMLREFNKRRKNIKAELDLLKNSPDINEGRTNYRKRISNIPSKQDRLK